MTAMTVLAMAAHPARYSNTTTFDTDSAPIGIDNRCTACISHEISDFVGPLKETRRRIKGFGGATTNNVMSGTLQWRLEDDQGAPHKFTIPNSYYVPSGGVRLLSPQHWAQTQSDKARRGSGTTTSYDRVVLYWDNHRHQRTIPLDPSTNVATLSLAPGFSKFSAFCAEADIDDEDLTHPMVMDARHTPPETVFDVETLRVASPDTDKKLLPQLPVPFDVDSDGATPPPSSMTDDDDEEQPTSVAAEFLRYHLKYNHISPLKIQEMARQGHLPKRLSKCPIPVCSACQFGKATRRPWRPRTTTNRSKVEAATAPGDVVSVDQLTTNTPGLVAHMTGRPTTARYKCATVFVDHYSNFGYLHLQRSTSAEETIQAKEAFETYARQNGVMVRRYHADNGTFRAQQWVDHCKDRQQALTFAGVNAHHENGKAEVRIRNIQDMARTSLIFASHRWKEAVTTNLWPYAARMANDAINATPWVNDSHKQTPTARFATSDVHENSKHWHHFGCPAYVLDDELQAGRRPPGGKWANRSRVGVYLGRSPLHSRNVALVLNIKTGLVSPQFHVKLDGSFHTVKPSLQQQEKIESKWQQATGFVPGKGHANKIAGKTLFPPVPHPVPHRPTRQAAPTAIPEGAVAANVPPSQPKNLPSATTRIGREIHPPNRLIADEVFSSRALLPAEGDVLDVLAMKATADPDTLYHHQAMREPDAAEFKKAMTQEVDGQLNRGVLRLRKRSTVPSTKTVLPSVWQMRRKRDIQSGDIKKYKARLNLDGSRMKYGRDYDLTYSPVVSWTTIRLLLVLVLVNGWHTRQLDFVSAYNQAPPERELYMEVPRGYKVANATEPYVLELTRNTYGGRQSGRVWNHYLVDKLKSIGFVQSKIDECVFYKGKIVYVLYTDDSILAGPDAKELDRTIEKMRKVLDLTVEGELSDFLGVKITRHKDKNEIHLTQPQLIDQILQDLRLKQEKAKPKDVPMRSSTILLRHLNSPRFDRHFHYRSIIGKLSYLEKGSRSELAYPVHQCARYSEDPRKEHGEAVKWIGRYLLGTAKGGTIMRPDPSRGLEVHVDADFAGNWHKSESYDPRSSRSRHGYIVTYAGCPVTVKSQIQGEICLSSTESEYTGLSYALREVIPIIRLLQEMQHRGIKVASGGTKVHCKAFEDNSGALEMARIHKWRPRTKHLATKLHHFRSYVNDGTISIHKIDTADQPADILTKPLSVESFTKHRKTILGW